MKGEGDNMRIIRISKCEDCPYFEYAYSTDNCLYVCEHIDVSRRCINDKTIIQDFCPLEEVK